MTGDRKRDDDTLRQLFATKLEPGSELIGVARDIVQAAARVIAASDLTRDSHRTAVICLGRLVRDLLCIRILGHEGYSYQAATIASSTLEYAYVVGYIGDNDARGLAWLEHRDPTRIPVNVKGMIRESVRWWMGQDEPPSQSIDGRYHEYQQLCAMKHPNPIFWMEQAKAGEDRFYGGPDFSDAAARSTQICFHFVSKGCAMAAGQSAIAFMGDEARAGLNPLFEKLNEVGERWLRHAESQQWNTDHGGVWEDVPGRGGQG